MTTQPQDGDLILHCGHVYESKSWHWHKVENVTFTRPDKSNDTAKWIIVCPPCQAFWGNDILTCPIRGDGVWQGNEPVEFKR